MALQSLCILIINILIFTNATLFENSFYPKMNAWESLRPGVLLHTLDQLTAHEQSLEAPLPLQSPATAIRIQRRIENDAEQNRYSTEDHLNNGGNTEYDYDRTYDQFVQKYFSSARNDALDADSGSIESHEAPYSSEYEIREPLTSASQKKTKEKCKKVRRKRQECLICNNPRNNEKSETCSYSTDTEPQSYAYSKQKSYKKHRDSSDEKSDESNEEVNDEVEQDEKYKQPNDAMKHVVEKGRAIRSRKSNQSSSNKKPKNKELVKRKDTSSCIRKDFQQKICYFCHNPGHDEQLKRCYAKTTNGAGNRTRSEQEVKKSEKKIYKRMVSYSYDNGSDIEHAKETKKDAVAETRLQV